MRGLLFALRAEWLRLARPRRAVALPAATLLAGGYAWALGEAAERGVLGARSGFYLVAASLAGAATTCALMGALFAATSIGGDLASGVARTALCRPVSRAAWMTGRVLTLCGAMCLVFFSAALGSLAAGALRYGLQGAFEGDYEIASASFLAGQCAIALGVSLCAQCCAVALGALAGSVLGRAGAAVVAVALCGAAFAALSRWPRAELLLPVAYLTAAFDRVAQLSQGVAGPHAGDGAPTAVAVCLGWLAGTCALAAAALRRRDILT